MQMLNNTKMSNNTKILFIIDKEMKSQLENKCEDDDLTISQLLRKLIKQFLENENV